MFSRVSHIFILLLLIVFGSAQTTQEGTSKRRLNPNIYANQYLIEILRSSSLSQKNSRSLTEKGQKLSLRFTDRLSEMDSKALKDHGIKVQHAMQAIYIAFVPWSALPFLEKHPLLENTESLAFHAQNFPFSEGTSADLKTVVDVGAAATHIHPLGNIGKGKIVADIDSGIDVLHPHFFFADGNRVRWLDNDQNGVFDVGIDGIDLNGDAEISENERLKIALGIEAQNSEQDICFEPRRDWLYLDRNKDGERNAGVSEGFSEEDPAYGEPIFVVDDVNRNNLLDLNETLVQLKTSKIVKFITKDGVYLRGENLISATLDPSENDFGHGTSVASILVGGQYGFHDRIGMAPGAEIAMYRAESDDMSYASAAVMDAVENRYDLILHEWTESIVSPIDGSGNYEELMENAYDIGIPSINPLGNLNDSGKHLQINGSGNDQLPFEIDEGFANNPYTSFRASIFWRSDEKPNFTIIDPAGTRFDIEDLSSPQLFGGLKVLATTSLSSRGTRQFSLFVWNPNDQSLSMGEWTLVIDGLNAPLVGRIGDPFSGWGKGIRWKNPTVDKGSLVYPASADSAFGVAALDMRDDTLRKFSGLGPRIDGAQVVDISSPDDPLTAFAATEKRRSAGLGRSWFTKFGGTSGASPHVAGSFLLLQSAFPDLSNRELEEKIKNSANTSGALTKYGPLPNSKVGAGKLNIYEAIFDAPVPVGNQRPTISGEIINRQIDLNIEDPDGDLMQVRFDFDYDGSFETDWSDTDSIDLLETWTPADVVHAQVRDAGGLKNGILLTTMTNPSIVGFKGGGFCQVTHSGTKHTWIFVFIFLFLIVKSGGRKPLRR